MPIVQMTLTPDPELPDVPLAIDDVHNDTDRQVMTLAFGLLRYARVLSVAPGVPKERLAALRAAAPRALCTPMSSAALLMRW